MNVSKAPTLQEHFRYNHLNVFSGYILKTGDSNTSLLSVTNNALFRF